MIGGVLLAVTLVDRNTGRTQTINVKFKILESGKTDWVPIIIGGMAIDHEDRGGLGLQPEKNSFYLKKLRMSIERCERWARGRYNHPHNGERVEDLVLRTDLRSWDPLLIQTMRRKIIDTRREETSSPRARR